MYKSTDNKDMKYYTLSVLKFVFIICQQYNMFPFLADNNSSFLSSSAKKEDEDMEDKKSIKKRIKELKVLDPKIAQNLCKYLLSVHFSSKGLDLFSFMSVDVRM